MAQTLKLDVDIKETSQALRSLQAGLDKPIRDSLLEGARHIVTGAEGFMRTETENQPPWALSSAAELYPDGPSSYYDARVAKLSATVGTTHPGARVWEYGGDIHPANPDAHAIIRRSKIGSRRRKVMETGIQIIHIPPLHSVSRSGDLEAPFLEQALRDQIDRLVVEHGF